MYFLSLLPHYLFYDGNLLTKTRQTTCIFNLYNFLTLLLFFYLFYDGNLSKTHQKIRIYNVYNFLTLFQISSARSLTTNTASYMDCRTTSSSVRAPIIILTNYFNFFLLASFRAGRLYLICDCAGQRLRVLE